MARIITSGNIKPKLARKSISATTSTEGIIKFGTKSFPEAQIREAFSRAINRASTRIVTDLKIALDNAIRSGVWPTLSGAADIYDTGELLESGRVTLTENGISIVYDAPYAALVHYGGYIIPYGNRSAAKVYLPARPWVDAVLNGGAVPAFDFAKYYQEEITAEFR